MRVSLFACVVTLGSVMGANAQTVPPVSQQESEQVRNLRILPPSSGAATTAQEEANKRIVLQWRYEFYDLGHYRESAEKYLAPVIEQSEPGAPAQRDQYVERIEHSSFKPRAAADRPALMAVFASGDLVMVVFPGQAGGPIHCNMYRVRDGRIDAMWVSGSG